MDSSALAPNYTRLKNCLSYLCRWLSFAFAAFFLAACNTTPKQPEPVTVATSPIAPTAVLPPPKIALVLGGGGTRGFAHIGVIKALEAQGVTPDIIVGTSVGSVVGALYATGYSGFQLQDMAIKMEEEDIIDKSWLNLNLPALILRPIKGDTLEDFINRAVQQLPLERLKRKFAVVATDLHSGEIIVFRTGNTGMAVRASSAVPGVFQPVRINGRYYVDGGLVKPVPVSVARSLGADFVIAVDISNAPQGNKTENRSEELLQAFDIMSQAINRYELPNADVVVRPDISKINQTNLTGRHLAVLEGEKATAAMLPDLKAKLAKMREAR